MSCSKFEPDVALYAGRDLPEARVPRVEQHIAGCADCRALLDELQGLLAGLRDETVEDAAVAQVRRRVFAGLPSPPVSRRYWKWAFAAAVLLALLLLWPRRPAPFPMAAARPLIDTPVPVLTVADSQPSLKPVRRRARKPASPLLVQFVTGDPNIVIYWLVDRKPQGD